MEEDRGFATPVKRSFHHMSHSDDSPLRSQVVTLEDRAGLPILKSQFVTSNGQAGHLDLKCQSGTSTLCDPFSGGRSP